MESGNIHYRNTPREVWLTHDVWQTKRDVSIEIWKGLTMEEREAIIKFVRVGMEGLYDTIEEWIPEGLRVEVGQNLDVTFKIFFTEVRDDVARGAEASTFRIRDAIEKNQLMIDELLQP